MRFHTAAAAALTLALATAALPAAAVDRTPIPGIVKPEPATAPWTDAEVASLRAGLAATLDGAATLHGAHVGVLVAGADGRPLYERAADDAFQVASTLKLLVGSVALERLGPSYRFATVLSSAPAPGGGTILTLVGGGDPLLRSADIEAAADAAAAAHPAQPVDVRVDIAHVAPGERHPPGWSLDDVLAYYAPIVDGLPFEENLLHVQAIPGAVGAAPQVALPPPFQALGVPLAACHDGPTLLAFTVLARTVAAGGPSTLDAERGRCGDVVLTGDVPQGAPSSIDVAVEQPEALARMVLVAGLRRHGIAVANPDASFGPVPGVVESPYGGAPAGTVIWRHDGEPLGDLLADLWLPSDNLVAEMLLREIDVAANRHAGTAAGGLELERAWLRGIGADPAHTTLVDGSGLSQYDRITPRVLMAILRNDWGGPYRDVVLDDLPVAGRRGSMRNDMRGTAAEGRVFAKTGSMSHVRGLAGYVATRTHGVVFFVLTLDDWLGADPDLDPVRAAFCARLAQL